MDPVHKMVLERTFNELMSGAINWQILAQGKLLVNGCRYKLW
jgi:hypothetical protein